MTKIIITLLVLSIFSLSACTQDKSDIVKKGDTMPSFTLLSSVNGNINSADLKGNVVLINIFATWCPPCQVELKEIQDVLYPKYKDNSMFKMLVVGREHTDDELVEYNEKKNFTFPLYPDLQREFTSKFATQNIPRIYLIDKSGKVVYTTSGYKKEEFEELMKLIEQLLEK